MLPNIRLAFESNNTSGTIGSWSSPETSSSNRGGWDADGNHKSDGILDDGTAIWGNPNTKKTGIDWTEKESLLNLPQQANSNSEKRIQKSEPIISSINGTEAWGAPAVCAPLLSSSSSSSASTATLINNSNSQQQSKLSDISGNIYGSKQQAANEPFSWGDSSSLQNNKATKNESSSPPNNSVWNNNSTQNHLDNIIGKQKASGWLASTQSTTSSMTNSARIEELNKQLEATSLFDAMSSSYASTLAKNLSTSPPSASASAVVSSNDNPNINNQPTSSSSSISLGPSGNAICSSGPGTIGGGLGSGINDLKQMSANFSTNDLIDLPNRQLTSGLSSNNNSTQSQLNSFAHPLGVAPSGVAPSRDLLKQMVHQIQLAVQAGHLNAHIMNQPMSTPTLQLVYTLLQQIKLMHQFQEIQQRTVNKSSDMRNTNLDIQIGRIQQNIAALQKAITQQQAALTKNQPLAEANNYSYASASKLSTNAKVPSNISNIDSFRRSSLIDNNGDVRSAQASFNNDATIDKNLLKASSSGNNILGKGQDFTKPNCFITNNNSDANQQQQAIKNGSLSAQATSSAWMAFNSSDLVTPGWSRISSNVSQDQQFSSDLLSDFANNSKAWRDSSIFSGKDNNMPTSMAPGANINSNRPNSASNNMKQMSENDILNNGDQSLLFYDWNNQATSDSNKSASSFSAIGGLSLQSNPWLFTPTSSSTSSSSAAATAAALNILGGGIENLIGKSSANNNNKMDNGNSDKFGGDSLSFLNSTASSGSNIHNQQQQQQQPSSLYDWGNLNTSPGLQFNVDDDLLGGKKSSTSNLNAQSSGSSMGGRPGPPPGLINSNFASMSGNSSSSNNGLSGNIGGGNVMSTNNKLNNESHLPSRESSSSLWSGAWFD